MSISMTCPCGKGYRVKKALAGKKIRCKDCNEVLDVPSQEAGDAADMDEFDALMTLGRHQEGSQPSLPPRVVKKRPKVTKRDEASDQPTSGKLLNEGWFESTNGGVFGGFLMIVIAVVWFVVGLAAGRIFFYPPLLLIIGIIAVVKGLFTNE